MNIFNFLSPPDSILLMFVLIFALSSSAVGQDSTFAERLGYPEGAKIMILHVDDVGMSHDSNWGAIRAIEEGAANSLSIMMPCAWVPEIADYYERHPNLDAGLHLTLTSEWSNYRWGPVTGAACSINFPVADPAQVLNNPDTNKCDIF